MTRHIKHLTLDYTTLNTWRTCPTKFRRQVLQGYIPETESDPLAFGSCIHRGLAVAHTTNDEAAAITAFESAASTTSLKDIVSSEMRSIEHGSRLLHEYFTHYGNLLAPFTPITLDDHPSVEMHLKAQVCSWLTYTGIGDGLVRDTTTEEMRGLEHKTSFYLGSGFANRVKPNDQVTGYVYLFQRAGYDVDTFIVNGLQTARRKIETSPSECFARHETRRTPPEIEEWLARLVRDSRRIIEDIESESFSANMPDSCTLWNSVCTYADVCNCGSEDRERMLEANYRLRPWPMFRIEWSDGPRTETL